MAWEPIVFGRRPVDGTGEPPKVRQLSEDIVSFSDLREHDCLDACTARLHFLDPVNLFLWLLLSMWLLVVLLFAWQDPLAFIPDGHLSRRQLALIREPTER